MTNTIKDTAAAIRDRVAAAPKETRTSGLTRGMWLNSAYHLTITPTELLAVADMLDDVAFDLETRFGTYDDDVADLHQPAALAVARCFAQEES